MKLKYVKFSDERRKKFCIKTIIAEDGGRLRVYKQAIFKEGMEHIRDIANNAKLLGRYYDTEACEAILGEDAVEFEYIDGKSLEGMYAAAMKQGDVAEIERLLLLHKDIVLGKEENRTVFSNAGKEKEVFGDCGAFNGTDALRCCNYDAIAGNIIFRDEKPVFIDYEWVFDYPLPVDVVLYHCVHNFYEHHPEMEETYPFGDAMKLLGVSSDIEELKRTYLSFFDYITYNGEDDGFALMKAICLKNTKTVDELSHENFVNICECARLQDVISDLNAQLIKKAEVEVHLASANDANEKLMHTIGELEQKVSELEETLQHRTGYIIARKAYAAFRSAGRKICRKG